ncbi:phosphotransferase [Glycomyces sp. NPDC021274]|uniref:phosphotransferase family protein n=1 Tax=Glycomyces sp. NPDC021274 TaxID=3155120 RepID=UPI0034039AB1
MTSDRTLPTADRIEAALAAHDGPWGSTSRVHQVEDLSPGLGQAAVMRVHTTDRNTANQTQWIVKIPGGGARSLLDSQDAQLNDREVAFFRSTLPARLPTGITTPPAAVIPGDHGREWIVMRDLGPALANPWTPEATATAAARLALLHTPVAADPALLDLPFLERTGHHAYAHHVPSGHDNLEALPTDPRLADLFTPAQVRALHRCLDAAEALADRAARLPPTLVHGDFTPRNTGLDSTQTLVLIDWEHAGVGPVGFDLATFVAMHQAFGGLGALDERALLKTYSRALAEVTGTDLADQAEAGFAIVHLTWGLHLRLGPGLAAVRLGAFDHAPAQRSAALEDIRTGCLRALLWAGAAGVDAGS